MAYNIMPNKLVDKDDDKAEYKRFKCSSSNIFLHITYQHHHLNSDDEAFVNKIHGIQVGRVV